MIETWNINLNHDKFNWASIKYDFYYIDKTEQDIEREQSLVDQWVSLTEERNAVLVPAAGSGIPGAPADWNPPAGMEPHIPVLFLDLNGVCNFTLFIYPVI